jgi:hypothetical protein
LYLNPAQELGSILDGAEVSHGRLGNRHKPAEHAAQDTTESHLDNQSKRKVSQGIT